MSAPEEVSDMAHFAVKNIGGIDETQLTLERGVTVLVGENATNRTSFLQSVMAGMGSEQVTLKGDATSGYVRFTYEDETYERKLLRTESGVQLSGDRYLESVEVADLFAFLIESNEARQAVTSGTGLREIIMRPVDVDAIEAEIARLEEKKEDIADELETIESRKHELSNLEQRRKKLQSQIDKKRVALEQKEVEIDDSRHDVQESRQVQEELEAKLDDLQETRSDLNTLRQQINAQEKSIRSLKQERHDLTDELDNFSEGPPGKLDQLKDEIATLRNRRQVLNSEISRLQSLIQYNEERLQAEEYEMLEAMDGEEGSTDGSVTDRLVGDDDSVTCWTCGSTVERTEISDTVERLQSLREEKLDTLSELKAELASLKDDKQQVEQQRRRKQNLETTLKDVEAELDQRTEQLQAHKERREELTAEIERLESEVEALESEDFEDILELHWDANQLEFDIDQLESDLESVTEDIAEIESLIERADALGKQREAVVDELTTKRNKVSQIEREAVEAFNQHMEAVLDILGYENLERVWIERVEREVREGRQKVEKAIFELHVVRTTENGAAYEDTVDHLSESEREVVGLIFALAGYLVHDLHETVPFMLLDSMEAIDADRIAALVDYFTDTADYLVIALLEEDAQALDETYRRITAI